MSRLSDIVLPTEAKARQLVTDRGTFAALDAAPGPGTLPLGSALLLPGFTGSKEDFIPLLAPLARAGFRVLAVDGRGQHETDGPRAVSAYAQAELAGDVRAQAAAIAAEVPGPAHLLGHSFGGLVARAAVLSSAQPPPWASLTLMNVGPAVVDAPQQGRTRMLVDALSTTDMASIWEAMRALDPRTTPDEDPEVAAFMRRRWLNHVPEQLIATGEQLLNEPDRVAELARVGLPTLVISGAEDPTWPVPWQDDMARRLGARRVVIANAGHSPNISHPVETARALVDFWASAG
ncbi:alpha/beta fold hydrolase [Streptomyces sp. 8K308]|uniref:alpha/beta fold hydrolase n=1 Tax=Streptomyces sp. 8K308 TaxID=2530388 RepID=UPI00104D4E48|nr:alpha/beta fold hydrolase [Streptomyces sp. 8K308]TDC25877.1 alpha/beta fold hydrolase [Streptomyces sp. 8K308]